MAAVQCSRCTAERRGFRRELDSWRYKLIHCVGFESILEGIYGSMLMRDLNLFDDCEPEELDDWSPESSVSHCTFCNLPIDRDQVPSAVSPLSSPSDYSPCQPPTISESSQRAHRFLQSVFHKKDVNIGGDSSIPLIAQELMKKMIHKFALEYASKCLLDTSASVVTAGESLPSPETIDGPLDLTVSRVQVVKEKEPEPGFTYVTDGVLDLSKRNAVQAATAASNDKSSGCCLPSELGHQQKKHHKNSPLNAVLSSLCPAHGSLLYQVLKLANQERLLPYADPNHSKCQRFCCCAHQCEVTSPLSMAICKTGAHDCVPSYPLSEEYDRYISNDGQGDCKCDDLAHQFALKQSNTPAISMCCCIQRCGMEMCSKGRPYLHCQSMDVDHICKIVGGCASCPSLVPSLGPPPPVCCNKANPYPNCRSRHSCKTQTKTRIKQELDDSHCPVLKRERSLSPPPLSPVPSDMHMKSHEKPPCLLHQPHEGPRLPGKARVTSCCQEEPLDSTKEEPACPMWTAHVPNGSSLQDVMMRFSEKLDTIRPLDKGQPHVAEKPQAPSVPASQKPHFRADTHLTEIITTVLHTGSASDYNLSELFNRQDSKESISPNTRSRRRQEVLAAIAKPPTDASTRRQTLNIKRELAQYYNRRKVLPSKCAGRKNGCHSKSLDAGETQGKMATEELQLSKAQEVEREITMNKSDNGGVNVDPCSMDPKMLSKERDSDRSKASDLEEKGVTHVESRRSRRNIVPPQRFSSYVTEPRKMFFVACFSESIFNQRAREDNCLTPPSSDKNTYSTVTVSGPQDVSHCSQVNQQYVAFCSKSESQIPKPLEALHGKRKAQTQSPDGQTDGCDSSVRKLRTSPRRQKIAKTESPDMDLNVSTVCENSATSPVQYTSPIKLMLVSPVKDREGVKYSLKTAPSGLDGHPQEPFDPCVESSWSGTALKSTDASTHLEPVSSALKSTTLRKISSSPSKSPVKSNSTSSPVKSPSSSVSSGSSPAKLPLSPKSVSPKTVSRRSPDLSPARRLHETSPGKSGHDSTPKRRRGRPKKFRPQLETKIKRPIGRPRKQKASESATAPQTLDKNNLHDDPLNKNLKITVVYGRSRRNKRTVSESFDPIQMEFKDVSQAGTRSSSRFSSASSQSSDNLINSEQFKGPLMQSTIVKCPKHCDAQPARKPGRPAKVKISGISVTVATMSPKQRKIKMKKESRESPDAVRQKRATAFRSSNDSCLTTRQSRRGPPQEEAEMRDRNKDRQKNRSAPVRYSKRIRKPSIYFLHAVASASSRSHSHSNALLRRSKQLLLNKASSEMKQEEQRVCVEDEQRGQKKSSSQNVSKMAEVSVDSIFTQRNPPRWWASSTEEMALNQELIQQIQLISGSWVSMKSTNEKGKEMKTKASTDGDGSLEHSYLVKALFDCPRDKPWSCSTQQLRSWFMQTTETKSLNIIKKASSRNPYEVMHFSRPVSKKSSCSSPQAERLRKHVKKFARAVPQSPSQHRAALRRQDIRRKISTLKHNVRRRLFSHKRQTQGAKREVRGGNYLMVLSRAKKRFQTRDERKVWLKRQRNNKSKKVVTLKVEAGRLMHRRNRSQTQEQVDAHKEPKHCTKAWSPETLKECCVFLKKINLAHHRTPERRDSSTVTLDDRSRGGGVKAVKRKRMTTRSARKSALERDKRPATRQKGKSRSPKVGSPEPPPAKMMRQSRMRGLTGPRWCDFVFGNYPNS
ncbi:uncharacterized protein lcorl isoform 1-T1 [Synchiropus picturatus]